MAEWSKILSRGQVEDRRSQAPVAIGGVSLAGIILYLAFNLLTGGNIGDALQQLQTVPIEQTTSDTSQFEGRDAYEVFASTVLGSNNDLWKEKFSQMNKTYSEPKLVLFRTATSSLCGDATSSVGPHYCLLDNTIYLDETFFDELTNRFGAKGGDVAQAYVISHEVGHHVQNSFGTLESATNSDSSIKIELQADCYAGLWMNSIKDKGILETGEISEALDAVAAVGDDRIQEKVTGYVNPETWTHGSSGQRLSAFNAGYNSGDLSSC